MQTQGRNQHLGTSKPAHIVHDTQMLEEVYESDSDSEVEVGNTQLIQ